MIYKLLSPAYDTADTGLPFRILFPVVFQHFRVLDICSDKTAAVFAVNADLDLIPYSECMGFQRYDPLKIIYVF